VALNLLGVVYYVVRTWEFTTIDWAVGPNPLDVLFVITPIFGVFFPLNLIWTSLVSAAILKGRKTGYNLFVVFLAGILWTGTFFTVRYRIGCAIEEAQKY